MLTPSPKRQRRNPICTGTSSKSRISGWPRHLHPEVALHCITTCKLERQVIFLYSHIQSDTVGQGQNGHVDTFSQKKENRETLRSHGSVAALRHHRADCVRVPPPLEGVKPPHTAPSSALWRRISFAFVFHVSGCRSGVFFPIYFPCRPHLNVGECFLVESHTTHLAHFLREGCFKTPRTVKLFFFPPGKAQESFGSKLSPIISMLLIYLLLVRSMCCSLYSKFFCRFRSQISLFLHFVTPMPASLNTQAAALRLWGLSGQVLQLISDSKLSLHSTKKSQNLFRSHLFLGVEKQLTFPTL